MGSSSPFTEGSFPYTIMCRVCGVWLGVAGWNMTDQLASSGVGLGTLLGPEETSGWVFFRAASAADHLTLTSGPCEGFWVWVVVVVGVVGCGCLLSVA